MCRFQGRSEAGGDGGCSECQPAVQVVPGEADSGQLVPDGGVESGESLFGNAGDYKEGSSADPCGQQEAGDCGGDLGGG